MKILILCAGDRSDLQIALSCLKHMHKIKLDEMTVCVLDKNKKIIKFLKDNKINYKTSNFNKFFDDIKINEFNWLLNIWGYKILKGEFIKKFKHNVNLHPSYLPYNRGRDPYYFSIINNTPIGVCIHQMDQAIDAGQYYIRKKYNFTFPVTAGEIFNKCLKEIMDLFIKNWTKIRNKKIKLKNYKENIKLTNYRKELKFKNYQNLDDPKNYKNKSFVLNCLAQDFSFLKQQIRIYGKIYNVKLKLENTKKKKWK